MSCFGNGEIIGIPIVYPEHFHQNDSCFAASADTINISFVATKHIRMEQLVANWVVVPTTSEPLLVQKISGISPKLNTILRSVDPSAAGENLNDLVCVIPYYWDPGDTVLITYPNTDDGDCGVEIFLIEVF